jgi:hypothetical protein
MTDQQPLFIIAIRYSVLTANTTRVQIARGKDLDEYRSALFDPKRLAVHRFLFESLTFPSVKAQADAGFADRLALQIITSTELPADERQRLDEIVKDAPWARVVAIPPDEPPRYHDWALEFLRKVDGPVAYAHCRLDDDDALLLDS